MQTASAIPEAPTFPIAAVAPPPPYRLYTPGSVGIATFLGSPAAGGALMAMNYARLGRRQAAVNVMVGTVVATVALIAVGIFLVSGAVGSAIGTACLIGMIQFAKSLQEKPIAAHLAAGGKTASNWKAIGVGVLGLIAFGGAIFAYAFLTSPTLGKKVAIGSDEIYITGTATEAEAREVGKVLIDRGLFGQGHGSSVQLSHGKNGTVVSFVINAKAANDAAVAADFTRLARFVAPYVGGVPMTMRLVDPELNELKSVPITWAAPKLGTRMAVGKDEIFYSGAATEADAKALAAALTAAEFLGAANAKTVLLSKDSAGTSIGFIVGTASIDKPEVRSSFEKIVESVADCVGGKPLTLRLLDPEFKEHTPGSAQPSPSSK
jgi:hypothetical protein